MSEHTFLAVLVATAAIAWAGGSLLQWLALRKQERLIDDLKQFGANASYDLYLDEQDSEPVRTVHVRARSRGHW